MSPPAQWSSACRSSSRCGAGGPREIGHARGRGAALPLRRPADAHEDPRQLARGRDGRGRILAGRGTLIAPAPWALFLIGFFWQLPHILAVGWMYRDDYGRSGLPVLAVVDSTGAISGRQAVLWSAALVPVSLLPATPLIHLTGI